MRVCQCVLAMARQEELQGDAPTPLQFLAPVTPHGPRTALNSNNLAALKFTVPANDADTQPYALSRMPPMRPKNSTAGRNSRFTARPAEHLLFLPIILERSPMKISTTLIVGAAALSSLFAISANAEQYQGVLRLQSTLSRAQVQAEAVAAAHSPDPYREGAYADVATPLPHEADRAAVRAQAYAEARAGNPYGDVAGDGVLQVGQGTVDRQAVRAQAHAAAAHGVTDGL